MYLRFLHRSMLPHWFQIETGLALCLAMRQTASKHMAQKEGELHPYQLTL
jgi:hypothetical protein